MVEPPVAASSGVAELEQDVLLATKLHVPGPRPGLVPRQRLLVRLDDRLARGLVLVCGPAGYGKTVLLADWARHGGPPVAWLSLDAGDNDPARFLLETSVLERLSGPLCDAVTGRAGSQALLEEAERAGLFVIPLDELRGWWRYHHLFADLLRARLHQEQPGRAAQLHRHAAAWYYEHDLADDAIGHAVAAGQMLRAARIIEKYVDMVYSVRGEAATIHRWLSILPDDLVRSRPRLLLAQALMAATSGHIEVVEPLLDAAECAPPGWADEPFEPTAGVAASYLINVPALTTLHHGYLAQLHGDAEATAAFSTQTLAQTKPGERLLSASAHGFLAGTPARWAEGAQLYVPLVSRRSVHTNRSANAFARCDRTGVLITRVLVSGRARGLR